jgi:hypothetical protein
VQASTDTAAVGAAATAIMGWEMNNLAAGNTSGDAVLHGVRLEEFGGAEGGM